MIRRDLYLNQLIEMKGSSSVKVITGIRRCGKSFLLNELFYEYLLSTGVKEDHILRYSLEGEDSYEFRDPHAFFLEVSGKIRSLEGQCYVFLDELQFVPRFVDIVLGLMHFKNADIYVTGSNSRLLSSEIPTQFRGRSEEIRMYPLTFAEFFAAKGGDARAAIKEYIHYGGLPALCEMDSDQRKKNYLASLFVNVYLTDIVQRHNVDAVDEMESLVNFLCSSVGSLTNPKKISDTLKTLNHGDSISDKTVKKYLGYLSDAFLFSNAKRYDIKGKRYFDYPSKFYCTDLGLRNACLNFREREEAHLMENLIYNELLARGYSVDVGVVEAKETKDGNLTQKQLEVDFVVNNWDERYYIQFAHSIPDEEKKKQEKRSLLKTGDGFRKILIVNDDRYPHYDTDGIFNIGIYDFLLNPKILEG